MGQDASTSLYHHKVGLSFYVLVGNVTLIDFDCRGNSIFYTDFMMFSSLIFNKVFSSKFLASLNMFLFLIYHQNFDMITWESRLLEMTDRMDPKH